MNEFEVKISEVKTEIRIVKLKAKSKEDAENVVCEAISNIGFDLGDCLDVEYETRVNGRFMNDDATLDDLED